MYTQLAMLLLGGVCGHTPQLKTCAPEIESGSSFDWNCGAMKLMGNFLYNMTLMSHLQSFIIS